MKPFNRQTFLSDLTWSGGWKQRIPFQLTFAEREGGLRGFRSTEVGGGRRVIAKVEDRYLIGRYKQIATIAVAGFAIDLFAFMTIDGIVTDEPDNAVG